MSNPNKHELKQSLAKLGEIAVMKILGTSVPRDMRRQAGRVLGAAAYRQLNGLNSVPRDAKANGAVLAWIIKEYEALKAKLDAEQAPKPESIAKFASGLQLEDEYDDVPSV